MKKVALLIANDGYQAKEYNNTKEVLVSDGVHVITVSNLPGLAMASNGDGAEIDSTLDQVHIAELDGIFLIGGPGALTHLDNPAVHNLLHDAQALNKAYGAICIAPRILAHAGVLKNKHATGWDEDHALANIFKEHKVTYIKKSVVTDGKIVTAEGPEAADDFGAAIAAAIKL